MGPVRSDEELMEAYVGGDSAAFDELFQRYAGKLLPVLTRGLTRQDALDLLQQTFLQVHRSRHDYQSGRSVRPWFFTIAINVKRQHLRSVRRRREDALDVEPAVPSEPTDDGEIRAMLADLPADQREILELHFVGGLPFARVAERIGVSVGAVRVRAHRAYVRLRAAFAGRTEGEEGEEKK